MEAYSALGNCYLSTDSLDLAEKYCRQGVVYFDGLSDSIGIFDRYELYKNLINVYVKKGDVDLVRDVHREAQKLWAAFCLERQLPKILYEGIIAEDMVDCAKKWVKITKENGRRFRHTTGADGKGRKGF